MNVISAEIQELFERGSKSAMEPIPKYIQKGICYYGADGLVYCSKCHTPKQVDIELNGKAIRMPCLCRCENSEYETDRKAMKHQAEIESLQRFGFNNKYYIDCAFNKDDNANPDMSKLAHAYVEKFDRFCAKGLGMVFYGGCGCGKTFMSACIGNALIECERVVYMTSISDLINMMSTDYGSHRQEILEKVSQAELLILDDLGTENILDTRKSNTIELTYKIIDSRYLSGKPMIISTNLDIIDILNRPDTDVTVRRIFERIMQKCKPCNFGNINRRLAQSRTNSDEFNEILSCV